ncbi:Formyl-coenzyme A transferase [Tritonibacter multivorans]|uniref:Formyl-coenzyme A transferase n=1 Tax=Tritonibacter multivorans TaxID=928856 RepID=A0A0P1G1Y5_9RHOB|nr:CoA transferase [Tritonibacter multivorans]MDA7419615.1 CoA transferase [Tritonibacter multivorans]CUH75828.1 Formyl-coenzyme A transferase [Tritonibacter multivorans]SFC60345.1 CoA-transferase family III [Tritonibacter multivorans]
MALLRALPTPDQFQITGEGRYDSAFAVTDLANASVGAVGVALADLVAALNLAPSRPEVTVDQRLASLWFKYSFRAVGWEVPDLWDPIAGNYQTRDGWIRLHTNLPHHRDAALSVLGCAGNREAVTEAVLTWDRDALETAVVANGGVAAAMRSRAEWLAHPQGQALAQEPLIDWTSPRSVTLRARPEATLARPLAGLRVLDLTRVLAGPVSTRTLAGFGADVLRIDPPGWDEPGVLQDITLGKRMGVLDLKSETGLDRLKELLAEADVLIHGYRPDALEALGLGAEVRDALAPNRLDVTLDAYGWTGPWAKRRGFDSLVQMSAGISDAGRIWAGAEGPHPLPVQALDHATGYLMAAACLSALAAAARGEPVATARLSLARTAETLAALSDTAEGPVLTGAEDRDFTLPERSGWGLAERLTPPLALLGCQMSWQHAAGPVGRNPAAWGGK